MKNDGYRKAFILLSKLVLAPVVGYTMLVFLIAFYAIASLFLSPLFPSYPDEKEAKRLTGVIFKYFSLKDLKLIYSIQNWNTMSYNVCFVFSYPENRYSAKNTPHTYINQRNNYDSDSFLREFEREVPLDKGCTSFVSQLSKEDAELFKEHDYHYQYGRGGKVFANDKDNLIMFEGYLYD